MSVLYIHVDQLGNPRAATDIDETDVARLATSGLDKDKILGVCLLGCLVPILSSYDNRTPCEEASASDQQGSIA